MRAAIYAAVSIADLGATVETEQLPALRAYCRLREWGSPLEFSDANPTASGHRPGFERLRAAVSGGQVDVVVVESLHRLFRDVRALAKGARAMLEAGVSLVATAQTFDSTTPTGRQRFLDAVALVEEIEVARYRERQRVGILRAQLAAEGDSIGRPRKIVNPLEVKALFERGLSQREAVKRSRAMGSNLTARAYCRELERLRLAGDLDLEARDRAIAARGGLKIGGRPRTCTATPDQVRELYESGLSRREAVDRIVAAGGRVSLSAYASILAELRRQGRLDDSTRSQAVSKRRAA